MIRPVPFSDIGPGLLAQQQTGFGILPLILGFLATVGVGGASAYLSKRGADKERKRQKRAEQAAIAASIKQEEAIQARIVAEKESQIKRAAEVQRSVLPIAGIAAAGLAAFLALRR